MAICVEPLVVDPKLGAVLHDGRERRVTRKAMDVLLCLAEAEGRVVTKEELIGTAWSGLAVSDEVVSTAVYELRRALGDDARKPRFIETVRKSGYRWVGGPVRRDHLLPPLVAGHSRRLGVSRWLPWGRRTGLAGLAVLLLVTAPAAEMPAPEALQALSAWGDPETCTLYLRGIRLARQGTRNGVERGIAYLREAAERTPGFGLAHVALADLYSGEGGELLGLPPAAAYREAQRALTRALQIDPSLPDAHASLAALSFRYVWDWEATETGFERAHRLSTCEPPEIDLRYAEYLSAMGRHEEAISALEEIVAGRPLDVQASWSLGRALYLARRYETARAQLEATLELGPYRPQTHRLLGEVHSRLGDDAAAFAAFLDEARLLGASPSSLMALEEAFGRTGLPGVWRWRLAASSEGEGGGQSEPVEQARLLAELGEIGPAMEALERAFEERRVELVWVGTDPAFDALRRDGQFVALLRSLRLPATARG